MDHSTSSVRTLWVALALGLGVELLFYGQGLGISVLLFVLLTLGALFVLGRSLGAQPAWRNLWLVVPLVFLAAMVAVRANAFVTFLNVLAVMTLLGLVAFFYGAGRVERLGLLGYPVALLGVGISSFYKAAPLLPAGLKGDGKTQRARYAWPVLRGLLLALPVLAVFASLLASADPIFSRYLSNILNLRFIRDLVGRAMVVLVSTWILAGALAYAIERASSRAKEAGEAAPAASNAGGLETMDKALAGMAKVFSIGSIEASIVLALVDLLFLSFVVIQFAYLFGGRANVTVARYTYAEYARRGFAELVMVAVLALGLVLGLEWLARRETPRQVRAFNALGSAIVALLLVMLASAFQRLRLYEQAYGYTEIRLYVYVFMVWLGAALLWFAFTLWKPSQRFAVGALVAALGFLVTLNLINPDAFIVRQNLARYRATGKLDVEYLMTLSEDSLPALVAGLDPVEDKKVWGELEGTHLYQARLALGKETWWRNWQAFNLSRWQAYNLLMGTDRNTAEG